MTLLSYFDENIISCDYFTSFETCSTDVQNNLNWPHSMASTNYFQFQPDACTSLC